MALVALVTCADGHQVALALTDADPTFVSRAIVLADRMDGAALLAEDGPFRLVLEGDERPA